MAFEWTPIDVGDIIRKTHIDELRDNIDYVKDNLANITYKNGVKNSYNDSEDKDEYDTYKGTYYYENDSDHRITEYSGEDVSAKSGEDNTDEGGYNHTHDGGDVKTVYGQADDNATSP